jgi:hypothetical protein
MSGLPDSLTYDQYVELMAMALSRDIAQVAEANRLLYAMLVKGQDGLRVPAIALADIEKKLESMAENANIA